MEVQAEVHNVPEQFFLEVSDDVDAEFEKSDGLVVADKGGGTDNKDEQTSGTIDVGIIATFDPVGDVVVDDVLKNPGSGEHGTGDRDKQDQPDNKEPGMGLEEPEYFRQELRHSLAADALFCFFYMPPHNVDRSLKTESMKTKQRFRRGII